MRAIIVRSILVIIVFATIGFIWGRSRNVDADIMYLDLVPSYRSYILDKIKAEGMPTSSAVQKAQILPDIISAPKVALPSVPFQDNNATMQTQEPTNIVKIEDPILGEDQVSTSKLDKPKNASKVTVKKEDGLFYKFGKWIWGLFSKTKKEEDQIRKEALSTGLAEKQVQESSPDIVPRSSARENKEISSNQESNNLLEDVDISNFLLNTDVVPKEQKK